MPTNLVAVGTPTGVELSWTTVPGATCHVYRDTQPTVSPTHFAAEVTTTNTSSTFALPGGTRHYFVVTAVIGPD